MGPSVNAISFRFLSKATTTTKYIRVEGLGCRASLGDFFEDGKESSKSKVLYRLLLGGMT